MAHHINLCPSTLAPLVLKLQLLQGHDLDAAVTYCAAGYVQNEVEAVGWKCILQLIMEIDGVRIDTLLPTRAKNNRTHHLE